MVEARQRDQWNHTADLMALLANLQRDPKRRARPFERGHFHPLREIRRRPPARTSGRISMDTVETLLGLNDE